MEMIWRVASVALGSLYPGYASYKAITNKNMKEYMRWMHYWTVFAFFTVVESVADYFLFWLPLYYAGKIIFVILLQYQFAEYFFQCFLQPTLSQHEGLIDESIEHAIMTARGKGRNLSMNLLVRAKAHITGALVQLFQVMQRVEEQATGGDLQTTTDTVATQRTLRADGSSVDETVALHRVEHRPTGHESPGQLRPRVTPTSANRKGADS